MTAEDWVNKLINIQTMQNTESLLFSCMLLGGITDEFDNSIFILNEMCDLKYRLVAAI